MRAGAAAVVVGLALAATGTVIVLRVDGEPSDEPTKGLGRPAASANPSVSSVTSDPAPRGPVLPSDTGPITAEEELVVVDGPASAPLGTRWEEPSTLVVERPGVVLDGLFVRGGVDMQADGDLTITDSVVEARSGWLVLHGRAEDCHIDVRRSRLRFVGTPDNGSGTIHGSCRLTAVGNDVSGGGDGIQVPTGNSVVQDNWIHDLAAKGDFHNDGVQLYGGADIRVVGNRIDIGWNGVNQNAAVFFQGEFDAPVVADNWLSGGGLTLRLEEGVRDAVVEKNVIVTAVDAFGPALAAPGAVASWEGNVAEDGVPVPPP